MPDQLVNLDMKHGVEAKNYEEVKLICNVIDTVDKIKSV